MTIRKGKIREILVKDGVDGEKPFYFLSFFFRKNKGPNTFFQLKRGGRTLFFRKKKTFFSNKNGGRRPPKPGLNFGP